MSNCPYLTNLHKTRNAALETIQSSPISLPIPKPSLLWQTVFKSLALETSPSWRNLHSFSVP